MLLVCMVRRLCIPAVHSSISRSFLLCFLAPLVPLLVVTATKPFNCSAALCGCDRCAFPRDTWAPCGALVPVGCTWPATTWIPIEPGCEGVIRGEVVMPCCLALTPPHPLRTAMQHDGFSRASTHGTARQCSSSKNI